MKENLVLLHGALGSRDQLNELKEIISTDFNVYLFNFDGHGGRVITDPFSIDLFVHNTLDFMQASGLSGAHFFGYSMGGYVALKLAHDFPGIAMKIITLGTKFNWTPESAAKEVRMMNPDVIEQKVPAFSASLRERHQPEDWKKNMAFTADMMTALGNGGAMTLEEFSSINNEVLVCVGTEDNMVTREESADVADQLKNGTLNIIEGFKHPIETVDKQILAKLCMTFLRSGMGEIRHLQDGKKGAFAYFVEGQLLGEMVYIMYSAKRMIIEHTEVDESLKGQNIGKRLLESLVHYVRKHDIKVVPYCPFAKAMLDRTKEWQDVLEVKKK